MVALNPPVCDFGQPAPDFDLPGVDGKRHTLASCRGPNGLLVMFICNHCPYVKAIIDRLIRDCRELAECGIGCVAIMSNDVEAYPDDAPDQMRQWSEQLAFPFPYLYDESQTVTRNFGPLCTPVFFGHHADPAPPYRDPHHSPGPNPAANPLRPGAASPPAAPRSPGPPAPPQSAGCLR